MASTEAFARSDWSDGRFYRAREPRLSSFGGREAELYMETLSVSRSEVLKASLRRLFIWKYVLLSVCAAVFGVFAAYEPSTGAWHFSDIWIHAFQGIFITLVVAVFFDVVIRKEQRLELDLDREELISDLSRSMIRRLDNASIKKEDVVEILSRISTHDQFLVGLGKLVASQDALSSTLKSSYFLPFQHPPHLQKVTLSSRLSLVQGDPTRYSWRMNSEMRICDREKDIYVVVTRSPAVANAVLCSSLRCDHLVLLSDHVSGSLNDFASNTLSITYEDMVSGAWRKRPVLAVPVSQDELSRHGQFDRTLELVCIRYTLPEVANEHRVRIQYNQELSIFDPYFYSSSTSYVFADEIKIDYSGIKERIGKVSALSFVSSPQARLEHDEAIGDVRVRIDGLLQPGEGALIVWRSIGEKHQWRA